MYFDSHAHLDEDCFQADFDAILAKMAANRVAGLMDIGCDRASSLRAIRLAERYPFVRAAVGSHPDAAAEVTDALIAEYRDLCQNPRVRAIGEIGLDYHYETVPREIQQRAFRMQMQLARELSFPVIVHEREAHGDGLAIIDEFPEVKGVFHCFSGSPEMAKELVRRGWYIGFTGVVTFHNARKAVETAACLPLERMLIETDCPYMAPEPFRGRRNDPSLVPLVAAKLAEIRGISPEEMGAITEKNAKTLFRIEDEA
jgi:TatD DNase family protein